MSVFISCMLRSWFCEVQYVAGVVFLCLFCESLAALCALSWEVFNDCRVFVVVGVGSRDDPLPACLPRKQHSVVQTDHFFGSAHCCIFMERTGRRGGVDYLIAEVNKFKEAVWVIQGTSEMTWAHVWHEVGWGHKTKTWKGIVFYDGWKIYMFFVSA